MRGPVRDKYTDYFEFDLNQWKVEEDSMKIIVRHIKQPNRFFSFTWHNIASIKGSQPPE